MKKLLYLVPLSVILISCGSSNDAPILNDISNQNVNGNDNTNISLDMGSNDNLNSSQQNAVDERNALEQKLKDAKQLLTDTANMDIATQQDTIRSNLESIKTTASELAEIDDFFLAADDLSTAVGSIEEKLNNFVTVGDSSSVVYELGGTTEAGDHILSFARSGGTIFALGSKGLYNLSSNDKTPIAMPNGVTPQSAFYSQKFQTLYISGSDGGIYALANGEISPSKITADSLRYTGYLIAYGANLYIQDPIQNALWKYASTTDGFSFSGKAVDNTLMNNAQIQSVAIDGNIYVLGYDKTIHKFTSGENVDITIDTDLSKLSPRATLFTDLGSSYLYILDPGNKKIVKLLKKRDALSFSKEYSLQEDFTAGFILPGDRKAYLTNGTKVFSIDL